jgi:hypothetical protein
MKLEEGDIYPFQVLRKTTIPDEGDFFLLRHQSGRRLLIPEQSYIHYNIEPGTTIECKVDKVSCTGKVYLEPLHPVYREGNEYPFDFVGVIPSEINQPGRLVVVKDVFNNEVTVVCADKMNNVVNGKITLTVERVRKGVPELYSKVNTNSNALKDIVGTRMQFNIIRTEPNTSGEIGYVLQSTEGHKAWLKLKHYKSYGFVVGDTVWCHVYGHTNTGVLKVEPDNPFYKVGTIYDFEVVKQKNTHNSESDDNNVLTLKDIAGNFCGIGVTPQVFNKLYDKTRLKCRVVGFRKGKPRLELGMND